jgi:hypothetical protein
MHAAVSSVLGPERFTEPAPDRAKFVPHVSIAYINRDGETEPIAAALDSLATRPVEATFAKADLLEFHRDHRMYEWTSTTPIPIGPASDHSLAPATHAEPPKSIPITTNEVTTDEP